jgi:hypothetical protein
MSEHYQAMPLAEDKADRSHQLDSSRCWRRIPAAAGAQKKGSRRCGRLPPPHTSCRAYHPIAWGDGVA